MRKLMKYLKARVLCKVVEVPVIPILGTPVLSYGRWAVHPPSDQHSGVAVPYAEMDF